MLAGLQLFPNQQQFLIVIFSHPGRVDTYPDMTETFILVKHGLDFPGIDKSGKVVVHIKGTVIDYCIKTDEKNGTSFFIEHLSRKSDFDIERLHRNLQTRFHIYSDKFVVHINDDEKYEINSNDIPEDKCQFVWKFPEDFEKDFDTETYKFKDLFEFGKVKGVQGKIYTSQTPLNKDVQGIVLFSRGKLVQEHSSFDDRANDNFFQYMSGSFDVDFIDNSFDVDNCSTDRKSLAWDIDENEELFKLLIMQHR